MTPPEKQSSSASLSITAGAAALMMAGCLVVVQDDVDSGIQLFFNSFRVRNACDVKDFKRSEDSVLGRRPAQLRTKHSRVPCKLAIVHRRVRDDTLA